MNELGDGKLHYVVINFELRCDRCLAMEIHIQEMIPLPEYKYRVLILGFGDLFGFSDFLPMSHSRAVANLVQCHFTYPLSQETANVPWQMPSHMVITASQSQFHFSIFALHVLRNMK